MKERGQGATEFLLMLALALTVVSTVIGLSFDVFDSLGSAIEKDIANTENQLINSLK